MDDENNNSMTQSPANAQTLALRIQKKIASKVSNKNVAKIFIDDTTGRCLDNLNKLIREYSGSKKQAEAILNDIIKIIFKIGILFKNGQLSPEELRICDQFRQTFHSFAKSALSFYEIEYTYEQKYLKDLLHTCQQAIQAIVKAHLTDKSKGRVDNVFGFFGDAKFLDEVFKGRKYNQIMQVIVDDVRKLLDEGMI